MTERRFQVNKAKLRSTALAVIALLVAFGPDILSFLQLGPDSPSWTHKLAKALGVLIAVATNGKAVLLINKLLPVDQKDPQKGSATIEVLIDIMIPVVIVLAIIATLWVALGMVGPRCAKADVQLDTLAPKLSKCWGTTCLQPAAAVNAVLFDLGAKKWQTGTTSLGAGLELLAASNKDYSSGATLHLTGVVSQSAPTYLMPTVGLVLFRYAELGYSYRFASGAANSRYLSVALTLPWDLIATGQALPAKAAAATP